MRTALRKIGNASGVIIPRPLLQEIAASAGDAVEIAAEEGRIVITPVRRKPREGWAEAASAIAAVEEPDAEWLGFANDDLDGEINW